MLSLDSFFSSSHLSYACTLYVHVKSRVLDLSLQSYRLNEHHLSAQPNPQPNSQTTNSKVELEEVKLHPIWSYNEH